MIVDVHWHLWVAMEKHPSTRAASARSEELGGERIKGFEIGLVPDWEKREQDLVRWLDEDGVDVACLVLAEYGLILKDNIFSVEGENRMQAEIMRRHPDRLLSFFGIDVRALPEGRRRQGVEASSHGGVLPPRPVRVPAVRAVRRVRRACAVPLRAHACSLL